MMSALNETDSQKKPSSHTTEQDFLISDYSAKIESLERERE